MADPTKYQRGYSFSGYQATNPKQPLPAPSIDNEFENIEQALGQAIDGLKDVRRSDGVLQNEIVGYDSLHPTVRAGLGEGALEARDTAVAKAAEALESAGQAAGSADAAADSAAAAAAAPPFDAALSFVTQTGTGAVARSVAERLKDVVNVMDFAAVGDGTTNDTPAFQAAANSFGGLGGRIVVPHKRFLIDTNLNLPRNVTIQGPHRVVGSIPTNSLKGVLFVNPTATITLGQGAGLTGLFVFRKGMSFPVVTPSAFAGTAVTAGGNDPFVMDCMIAGFNQAFISAGHYRPKLQNLMLDNNNGIDISQSPDAIYIQDVHCWPFATVEAFWTGTPGASLDRGGKAFHLHNTVDWPRLVNCFSFGYFRGFVIDGVNSSRLTNCGTDGDPTATGSVGYEIKGGSNDCVMTACQSAAALSVGVYVQLDAGTHVKLIGCDIWGGTGNGIQVVSGDVTVIGGSIRDKINGIVVDSAASLLRNDFTRFSNNANNISASVATSNVRYGENNIFHGTAAGTSKVGGNIVLPSVASAAAIALPNHGELFRITGTTNFADLFAGWPGRKVTLLFDNVLTVTVGGASPSGMKLNNDTSFVTKLNSTISFVHDGSFWIETGRKV